MSVTRSRITVLVGEPAWLARATMPDDSGAAEIPGLENPVSIAFDANQVPTVRARFFICQNESCPSPPSRPEKNPPPTPKEVAADATRVARTASSGSSGSPSASGAAPGPPPAENPIASPSCL